MRAGGKPSKPYQREPPILDSSRIHLRWGPEKGTLLRLSNAIQTRLGWLATRSMTEGLGTMR